MKRIITGLLAVIIAVTAFSFPTVGYGASTDAYISGGKYYRVSDGKFIECQLDYNEMIEQIQEEILGFKATELHIMFASPDGVSTDNTAAVKDAQSKLQNKIEKSIFTKNSANPELGMYLFKNSHVVCSAHMYPDAYDTPIDGVKYNTYGLTITIEHFQTKAENAYVSRFAKVFTDNYIPSGADEYTRVKTIYDFIIRNSAYDYEVFADDGVYQKFPKNSDRNRVARSAYGVLMGNQISYKSSDKATLKDSSNINVGYNNCSTSAKKTEYINNKVNQDFENYFASKTTVTGEKVVKLNYKSNKAIANGLAVCEGYSQLFYYLCKYNGIDARIVDGDYIEYISSDKKQIKELYGDLESGKASDPHEWNYVYLDDDTGKGYRWFIVDTTFGSQLSISDIDYNNYDYFLIGTTYSPSGAINYSFSVKNHQQPYVKNTKNAQLYDWYSSSNLASDTGYKIKLANLDELKLGKNSVIIQRKTKYSYGTRYAYIFQGADKAVKVTIDENSTVVENIGGFNYNGNKKAQYRIIIPYMAGLEYDCDPLTGVADVGKYKVTATGKKSGGEKTRFSVEFNIVPVDMSNDSKEYSEIHVSKNAAYNGNVLTPSVYIVDGHGNQLTEKDYDIKSYKNGKNAVLKNMGDYDISIDFKGNYSGKYKFVFKIGKINLSQIDFNQYSLPYIPSYYRKQEGVYKSTDFFNANISSFVVGDIKLNVNSDYVITSSGSIDNYGDSGKITIKAASDSKNVKANTKNSSTYKVNKKFDISGNSGNNGVDLNGKPADSNTVNKRFYNGKAKKPTKLDYLGKYLEEGKDYKIISYSNNVNAGKAYVTVEGINGCTGRAKMYFIINPADITKAKLKTTVTETGVNVKVTLDGKKLKKGTDYKKTVEKTKEGYLVTIKGINNYSGVIKHSIKTVINDNGGVKPTKTGNKVKLSKSSYVYSGSECKPSIKFTNGDGKDIDPYYYTIKYSSNVNVGTAKAVVKLKNGFEGSITVEFEIKPKATSITSVTALSKGFSIKWNEINKQATGYQIQCSTSSDFSSKTTITIKGSSTTSAKIKNLSGGKRYYVRIRTYKSVNGKKYYSSWSEAKSVKTKK